VIEPGEMIGSVEISGQVTARQTYGIPPIVVELPLTASASVTRHLVAYAFLGIVTCLVAIGSALQLAEPDTSPAWSNSAVAIATALIAAYSFAQLVSLVPDARRRGPTLFVDGDGLRDERTGSSLLWKDVEWMGFYHRDRSAWIAAFGLRSPVPATRRYFRPEGLVVSTPTNELHVMITLLDKPAGMILEVMRALVRRHGGRVDDVYKSGGRLRW
jgi:hypothetical protein